MQVIARAIYPPKERRSQARRCLRYARDSLTNELSSPHLSHD